MRYVVQYKLPYMYRRIVMGIEAESAEAAMATARRLLEERELWGDTAETPLLFDEYVEDLEADRAPDPAIMQELGEAGRWPAPGAGVSELRQTRAAFRAAHLLVEAYRRGEAEGGSIDWDDLDQAFEAALKAMPER